ncbi:GGDEF domain-containing response regulator [Chitinolyticbacter meiyuanensis]|uniref:GGDEF domain-containing response regulator n=1 Tax=Chitinolyticbacter meiyuanensis TaxID=682798 RepID=UPI0011E59C4B|nr:diguanylate cyclase [Chitinolyticbacter meiyuanensis]
MEREPPKVYLALPDAERARLLASQLQLYGYGAKPFERANALLAAVHGEPPFAVVLGESGLPDDPLARWLPLLAKLKPGSVWCEGHDLTMARQIELMRHGVSGFLMAPCSLRQLYERFDSMQHHEHPSPYRVLVLDDSEAVLHWVEKTLRNAGMDVRTLHDPLEIFIQLERFLPDVVLLDVYMPGYSGDEIARLIRQDHRFDSLPIVFLSTETSRSKQLMARSMGGDDFLVKNMPAEELVAAVGIIADRYRMLRHWMVRDGLTGLLNHTRLTESLEREVERASRKVSSLSFAMVDIDHFKQVNDQHGHAVGDVVIRALSGLIKQFAPGTELVGRYGGEEFALIFPDTTLMRAAQAVDEMRQRFAGLPFQDASGAAFACTLSAGVAQLKDNMRAGQLIEAADGALYQAKAAGRNTIGLAR